MNLILFMLVLLVMFMVVRIGALAFELTGLERSIARFQALSCFTATGFTTRESELITSSPRRRRIAMVLIVIGHAGFVTLIGTFANSLRWEKPIIDWEFLFHHQPLPPAFIPWLNLGITLFAVSAFYWFFTHSRLVEVVLLKIRRHMINRKVVEPVNFEELTVASGGYGVFRVAMTADSPLINQTARDLNLASRGVLVMALERQDQTLTNPVANIKILPGDQLLCFARGSDIEAILKTDHSDPAEKISTHA